MDALAGVPLLKRDGTPASVDALEGKLVVVRALSVPLCALSVPIGVSRCPPVGLK
jgi:hypothetical protein